MNSKFPISSERRELRRVLITGGSGYLGRQVARLAASRYETFAGFGRHPERIVAGEPIELDLLDPESSGEALRRVNPDVVIHTAAINPGGPEELMPAVNVVSTRHLASTAAEVGCHWIHVSTDVVHDGLGAPYDDSVTAVPTSLYGQTKAAGEQAVLTLHPDACIVRTSLIYGLHEIDHGTKSFADRLRRGESVRLFSDVLRQPVWVETLAEALLELSAKRWSGFLNVAGSQILSREQFGRRMLDWWQIDGRESVSAVKAEDIAPQVPRDLRLCLDRAHQALRTPLLGVDEVLGRHLSLRVGTTSATSAIAPDGLRR